MFDSPIYSSLIYDVGMHKSEDTDYYLKKGFDVIGFEADPELVSHSQTRFADAIACERLRIVEGAIVNSSECHSGAEILFYRNRDNTVLGTLYANRANRNEMLGATSEMIHVQKQM